MSRIDEVVLGRQLQKVRKSAGFTQQLLCQQAQISYSTLAKIERGAIKSPSVFTIMKLAEVMGVSLDHLLGITPPSANSHKKISKTGIRFVYFDVNGCLVRFFHRAFSMIAEDTGIASDQIETAFWHYNDSVCRGELSMDEFNSTFARDLGVPSINWSDYYLRAVEPIAGMDELLSWVSEHYNVGLLSNIMPGQIQSMIDEGLIPSVEYHSVVDSSEVGAIKPEPKMYEIAEGLAEVAPNEILFIDDSRPNLMTAERQGWKVLWFDDYQPSESIKRIKQALQFD